MYVFSGQSGAKITNSLFRFTFGDHNWIRISTELVLRGARPPPDKRYGHAMVAFDRQIYIFGGATGSSTLPNDLHCFDLDSQTWSMVRPATNSQVPTGRLFHSAAVVCDAMYMFGGTVDNNVRSGEMFRFQFSTFPKCALHDDFGRLLESRQFSDVTFLVGRDAVAIAAHQAFVAARSPFLSAKLQQSRRSWVGDGSALDTCDECDSTVADSPCTPPKPTASAEAAEVAASLVVRLPQATPRAFEMVLSYIYTDSIHPPQKGEEACSDTTVVLMIEVYRLSVQFQMLRLEHLCVRYLEANISLSNVLAALQCADSLGLEFIKELCLRFITKESNYAQIIMSKEFEVLPQLLMVAVIRRKQLPPVQQSLDMAWNASAVSQSLEHDMERFLKGTGSDYCDITLMLNDTPIRAHKAVLAARCSYFEAMFRSFMPESGRVVVSIGDTVPSRQAFDSLMRYIYHGDVSMPAEDSLYLFSASSYYGFSNTRLQAYCKHNLELNVSIRNVVQILEAADSTGAVDMKRHALSMIVQHYSTVARQPQLRRLGRELLLEIMDALAESLSPACASSSDTPGCGGSISSGSSSSGPCSPAPVAASAAAAAASADGTCHVSS